MIHDLKTTKDYPVMLSPIDFNGVLLALNKVTATGAEKHGMNSWMDPMNNSLEHIANHNSMFHHLAESFAGHTCDKDSGVHPLIHLAWRALAAYHMEQVKNDTK